MIDPAAHELAERCIAEVIFRGPVGYIGEWHSKSVSNHSSNKIKEKIDSEGLHQDG